MLKKNVGYIFLNLWLKDIFNDYKGRISEVFVW